MFSWTELNFKAKQITFWNRGEKGAAAAAELNFMIDGSERWTLNAI